MSGKHIKLCESIIGLGGYILSLLTKPRTVEDIWFEFEKVNNKDEFPAYHDFENFILTIDFLYMIGAVSFDIKGLLKNETN